MYVTCIRGYVKSRTNRNRFKIHCESINKQKSLSEIEAFAEKNKKISTKNIEWIQ